jgi:hypothetical protein
MDYSNLAQDRDSWFAVGSTVINFGVRRIWGGHSLAEKMLAG